LSKIISSFLIRIPNRPSIASSMIASEATVSILGTQTQMHQTPVKTLSASLHEGQQHHRANYVALKRSNSCPTIMKLRSSMRVPSLDESLHNFDISRSRGSVDSSVEALPTLKETDPRNVIFAEIRIREYERSLGDNPSCSSGPPISLGWKYQECKTVSLDKFESFRPPRRSQFEMLIPRAKRQDMLVKEWNTPPHQCARAIRENMKTKTQRRRTIETLGFEKFDTALESARRKIIRTVTFQKRPSKKYDDMMVQADKAAASVAKVVAVDDAPKYVRLTKRHTAPIVANEDDALPWPQLQHIRSITTGCTTLQV